MSSLKQDTNQGNPDQVTGARYWRSLDDLAQAPAFKEWAEREFPEGASELHGFNRRHFMKIMAASFGMAGLGLAGCRRPESLILPYAHQPEYVVPGIPQFYSSSRPTPRENIPVIVQTHEARPTKLEGNPSYQPYGGSTDLFTQASVLDLYDPSRSQRNQHRGSRVSRSRMVEILREHRDRLEETGGQGFAFLAEPSTSPARARLVSDLKEKYPDLLWAEYTPHPEEGPALATKEWFGKKLRPHYHFEKAKRILSIDADFLGDAAGSIGTTRAFSKGRKVHRADEAERMNRLYAVEPDLTLTGGMADHRLRVEASNLAAFTALLTASVLERAGWADETIQALRDRADALPVDAPWIEAAADDLWEHRGASLVTAGAALPKEVHLLVIAMNAALAADDLIDYLEFPDEESATIGDLCRKVDRGEVKTLFVLGGNPAFNAPADLGFYLKLASVEEVVHYGYYQDESSEMAGTHIAATHFLESWGDGRAYDGTYLPVQPMIEPLVPAFNELEVLAILTGHPETDPYALVKESFQEISGLSGEAAFNNWLASGLLPESGYSRVRIDDVLSRLRPELAERIPEPRVFQEGDFEVVFKPSRQVGDGRYANNGWLMECPEPMSKLTWDNAVLISPRMAKELESSTGTPIFGSMSMMNQMDSLARGLGQTKRGRHQAPVVEFTLNGVTERLPIMVLPGLANHTVVMPCGFGRRMVGPVGQGAGFDAYAFRSSEGLYFDNGATLTLTGDRYELANAQDHWSLEGRAIFREGTVQEYQENPEFTQQLGMEAHSPPIYGEAKHDPLHKKVTEVPRGGAAYQPPSFTALQQWGMSIDLNLCTGCNACVVACQSENNIPIVGKEQVLRGREMHWIRLDRYFAAEEYTGDDIPEDVQVSFHGMACQHCELAPCEMVCPVNATVHDEQGLNVMAYNRCVGTRYCANNCPYKVRRFNFFDYNKREIGKFYLGPLGPDGMAETHKLQKNPNVTIRMRGVMEKCTYCVQRIETEKIHQKVKAADSDDLKVPDGRLKVACQQACPSEAINFGDLADPETQVYHEKSSDRDYAALGYLGIRPRTTYLSKLRNPNPEMPKGHRYDMPYGRQLYEDRYGHGNSHGQGEGAHHHSPAGAHAHSASTED